MSQGTMKTAETVEIDGKLSKRSFEMTTFSKKRIFEPPKNHLTSKTRLIVSDKFPQIEMFCMGLVVFLSLFFGSVVRMNVTQPF